MKERTEDMIHASYIATLAEGVAMLLFLAMIAVWAALGSGA